MLAMLTSDFWEPWLGWHSFYILLGVALLSGILFLRLLYLIFKMLWPVGRSKLHYLQSAWLSLAIIVSYLYFNGHLSIERFMGKPVLVAGREGAANCTTVLKLFPNGHFKLQSVCFGISRLEGEWQKKSDTIFFSNFTGRSDVQRYEYARYDSLPKTTGKKDFLFLYDISKPAKDSLWLKIEYDSTHTLKQL
ncbi:hypothetical protein [Phnomibacter sp. MR]|uniref:hypothetical protein n=1 Tax=Phnomibacter sp. MR TaxID=3042318 RepID=UPI003A807DF5